MQLNIVFVTGGLEFNGNTDREKALGGSETALINVARSLAKIGHYVRVFCSTDHECIYDNVFYWDLTKFQDFVTHSECDVLIVSRFYEFLRDVKVNSKLNILWNHDILVDERPLLASIWNYDYMYCLSNYHKNQFIERVPEIGSMIKLIPNGVDKAIACDAEKLHRIMFTSRPERGLYQALKIYERYGDKTLGLLICNYETVNDPNVKEVERLCAQYIEELIEKGFDITIDRFAKADLYKEIAKSKAVLYPTQFPEIFCISAIEAQLNGTAYITTDDYALKEVVPYDKCEYTEDSVKYIQMLMKVLRDDKYRKKLEKKGLDNKKIVSWDDVANQMVDDAISYFEKRSEDKLPIIKRLVHESDYVTVKEFLCDKPRNPGDEQDGIYTHVNESITQINNESEKLYNDETTFEPTDFDALAKVPRMNWVAYKVKELGCKSVLSYGCHNGVSEILISNMNPDCKVVGYDISDKIIKEANKLRSQYAENKSNIKFKSTLKDELGFGIKERSIDAVYAGEILEHVEDYASLIDELESYIKPGGKMIVTVPRGAWEKLSHLENIEKGVVHHIHGFDWWDIQNIFGAKKDFDLVEYHDGGSKGYYGEPIGNYLLTYTVDHDIKCGKRDIDRKLLTYRPYQSISACIIARDAKNGIERLLDSINYEMDEIIIGVDHNKGECDEFIRRIEAYPKVKWFYLPKRIIADEFGFANARNATVEKANSEWILWIDTDEQLLKAEAFRKYLDTPYINSYNIPQHHPQLDHFIEADHPQRLFRKSKGLFVGYIHEQVQDLIDINKGVDPSFILSNTHILNYGELHEAMRRSKGMGRNLGLLEVDVRENVDKRKKEGKTIRYMSIILMMRDFINRIKYTHEEYGTFRTKDSLELSLPTIKNLYNKFFKELPDEQDSYYKNLAYKYLMDAMEMCEEGTKVKLEIGDKVYYRRLEEEDRIAIEDLIKVI